MSDEEYMSDVEEYFDDEDNEMEDGEEGMPCVILYRETLTSSGLVGTSNSEDEILDEMDEMDEPIKIESSKNKRKIYETDFECLSGADVEKYVHKDAEHIVGIFGIDVSN